MGRAAPEGREEEEGRAPTMSPASLTAPPLCPCLRREDARRVPLGPVQGAPGPLTPVPQPHLPWNKRRWGQGGSETQEARPPEATRWSLGARAVGLVSQAPRGVSLQGPARGSGLSARGW